MPQTKLSIVIPCFNQGLYLKENLECLSKFNCKNIEIIIINDGSTDPITNQIIGALDTGKYRIINQENKGLAEARNAGIILSEGNYILPLDADNMITEAYITKSIAIFESDENIAVIYGNAEIFGSKKGALIPGEFNLQRLMWVNFIDACAVIRKSVLIKVGMYDKMPVMGFEDWDLWLRIAFEGHRFHYVNETLFRYRFNERSMMRDLKKDIERRHVIEDYLSEKYKGQLDFQYISNYFNFYLKKKPIFIISRLLLKKYFPNFYNNLILQNKFYKGHIYD